MAWIDESRTERVPGGWRVFAIESFFGKYIFVGESLERTDYKVEGGHENYKGGVSDDKPTSKHIRAMIGAMHAWRENKKTEMIIAHAHAEGDEYLNR